VTGVLLVDKPEGMTSAGVIRALKPRLGRIKVGHLGTLDPFASGLLPLCLGEATKVARYLLVEHKAYEGTIRLGTATDTLDRTGTPIDTAPVPALAQATLDAVAAHFTGRQEQVPPMYSALKRDGVPLYKLARKGESVERASRPVAIRSLELLGFAPPLVELRVRCSKGTYIRTLAEDIGAALGTGAHLAALRRTACGGFRVEQALTLDELAGGVREPLLPLASLLAGFPATRLDAAAEARLRNGQPLKISGLQEGLCALYRADGALIGLARAHAEGIVKAVRLTQAAEKARKNL